MRQVKKIEHSKNISIGIPTYEAGNGLVMTVNSIIEQTFYDRINEILIVVDGRTIKKEILKKLTDKKIKIVYFKERKGQSTRINDIFRLLNTNHLILTNDDVLLDNKVVENITKKYLQFDLIASNVRAIKENRFFEQILEVGQSIRFFVAKNWKNGNNYLSCNGRLIVLSKNLYKNLSIPEKIWNNDAYIYIQSQILDLNFFSAPDVVIYYKSPSSLKEHISQSNKFQKSIIDLQRYFNEDISSFYTVPLFTEIISIIKVLLKSPLLTVFYLLIFVGTRIKGYFSRPEFMRRGFWNTDLSTKKI